MALPNDPFVVSINAFKDFSGKIGNNIFETSAGNILMSAGRNIVARAKAIPPNVDCKKNVPATLKRL